MQEKSAVDPIDVDDFIPFAQPSIGEHEINEVVNCMRSGWLTTGRKVAHFEEEFAARVGAKHAMAVTSATAGLHLALTATNTGPDHVVVTTPFTFTATAEIVRYVGADVVFSDIDPGTLNICPDRLAETLHRQQRPVGAIIPVHFAGLACDMVRLADLSELYQTPLIEDAAHSFPATFQGRMIGSIGFATVFSFYATKTLCTGEGGMVVTDDDEAASWIRTMRLHGINRDVWDRYTSRESSWRYDIIAPGFKYNMTDIAAAIGIHQLARAEEMRIRRADIAARYDSAFAELPVILPPHAPEGDLHAWHLYVLRLDTAALRINRDEFIDQMTAAGIGTSVHFIPLHLHTYWRERYHLKPEDFPVSSSVFEQNVSLPIYPSMSDAQIDRVIEAVSAILSANGR